MRAYELEEMIRALARKKRGKILFVFLFVAVCVLALEGIARITSGPRWLNTNYIEISSDFANLDALIKDAQNTQAPKYYEEFLYAPRPFSSAHINYTDYYSARLTPDSMPISKAEHVIWAFGGSTMQNEETTDRLTIANTWAKIFNHSLGPTHVKNFGMGGYFSSYELIKFQKLLREVPESERPTVAIFYDGYNEALNGFQYGPGRLQSDLSLKLQALVEQDNFTTGAYALSRALSHYFKFWDRTAGRLVEHLLFRLPEPSVEAANLADAVHIYTSNVKMIQATCQAFEIDCFFVLQPLIVTKKPLSHMEQDVLNKLALHPRVGSEGVHFVREFYERVVQDLDGNEHFVDASHILDGRTQPDFYDFGHVGAQSPPVIGEKIAHLILSRLNRN